MRRIAAILFVCSLVCCFTLTAFAQEGSATLTGFIQDSSRAFIPGVKVTAIETNTNQRFEATTGKDGSYTIVSLPVGPYQVQVERPGFKTILKDDLFLHTQDALQINFQMAVGSTSETVTVNGSATNDSPAVGMVVTHEFIDNMPLNGRSLPDLIALAPGAVANANDSISNGTFSINGQYDNANYFTVDGVSTNTATSVSQVTTYASANGTYPQQTAVGTTQNIASLDAVQEFKIQTSGYSAEYGRQPGGQIEIVTRSGGESFHGTLSEYFRNEDLDANHWFANHTVPKTPREPERQNDFGGTLGGPVKIPVIYKGNRNTFFFGSYEGLRLQLPGFTSGEYDPSVAFRQSADPAIQPFLNAFPIPNGAPANDACAPNISSCSGQFTAGYSSPSNLDSISARLDQSFGDRLKVFLRNADTRSSSTERSGNPASQLLGSTTNTTTWTGGATWKLSNTWVNELRLNYNRTSGGGISSLDTIGGAVPFPVSQLVAPQYLMPGQGYKGVIFTYLQGAVFQGYQQLSSGATKLHQVNIVDGFSFIHGHHTMKYGVDYRRLTPIFAGTYQPAIEFVSGASIQNGIVDYAEPSNSPTVAPHLSNLSLYAQDSWKATSRLSLEFGVRWEFNPPLGATNGLYPLAVTQVNNLSTMQLAPTGTSPYRTTFDSFAPRFGFAYQLRQASSRPIVIRGAVGVFYDTGQALALIPFDNYPFHDEGPLGAQVSIQSLTQALASPSPTAALTPPYGELDGLSDPDLKLPYTEQWNLSADYDVAAKNTLTLSYVGNGGKKLLYSQFYGNISAINPNFTAVMIASNAASSSYNALQLQDKGYITRYLQTIVSYSWAHAIDNSSDDFEPYTNPVRGNSDRDLPQVLTAALTYQLPVRGTSDSLKRLTHDWSLSTMFTAESGYPFNVIQGTYSSSYEQTFNVFPDRVTGVPLYLHGVAAAPGGWEVNKAAFNPVPIDPSTNAPLQPSTLGRNFVRGPGFWNFNSSIQKSTEIADRLHLLFRADAFNLFNHPNFGQIDNKLNDPTFGQAIAVQAVGTGNSLYATGVQRSLQLMLKLQF